MNPVSTDSTDTLGGQRQATRHALYVGRESERARFADALAADTLPFHIAHIYGPGGIGKTALLDEIARLAHDAGAAVARVDARDVDPTPMAFESAARDALARATPAGGPRVLLVDTYEQIAPLDDWMRRTFAPSLRASDLLVIAGRQRPGHEWATEWAGQTITVALRDLSDAEACGYLAARGVPEASRDAVLAFTHGHPLALALAAEWVCQQGGPGLAPGAAGPGHAPDLVGDLMGRFVSTVPSPAHQTALEAASVVRSVTVPLLRALLPPDADAGALFRWLRGLTFTETDAGGVRLHDVVRETVEADLRWRDPERHAQLHARARQAYGVLLREAATEADRRRALADYVDLYRHNTVVQPLLQRLHRARAEAGLLRAGALRDGDADAIRAMVARHQGETEADAVARWLVRQPDAAEVFVDATGGVAGFLLPLDLASLSPDDRAADPVVAAAWGHMGSQRREGERALLFRSWLDAEHGQGVSVVQSLVFARTVEHYLTTPGLATSVLLTSEPDLWTVVLQFAGLHRWPDAESGPLAAFGKDWRASPPAVWLDDLAERSPSDPPAAPDPADVLVVLSQDAFADAVRDALKVYARPHRLADSLLLRARLVRERGGDPVEALQQMIADAAAQLDQEPRERPYFAALDLTYLHPALTQAAASEALDVPFSTYRRHLGRGVDHVIDALWRAETRDDAPE